MRKDTSHPHVSFSSPFASLVHGVITWSRLSTHSDSRPEPPIATGPLAPDNTADLQANLEDSKKRFLAAVKEIRPRLHRFCARMTGSVLDGEDLVQETLAQAFYYLSSLKDQSRLEPWLFRIAHNKCVDFLRRERRQGEDTVPYLDDHVPDDVPDDAEWDEPVSDALAALVAELPPMERACVLLKDVLDYRLAEIAEVVESTVGGVKAALHRGRAKLRVLQQAHGSVELDREQRALVDAYIERFNRRDWEGLRRLIQADARIEIVGVDRDQRRDLLRQLQCPPVGVEAVVGAGGQRAPHRTLAEGRSRLGSAYGDEALVAGREGGAGARLRARGLSAPPFPDGAGEVARAARTAAASSRTPARITASEHRAYPSSSMDESSVRPR